MKLINNRYKVEKFINKNNFEDYLVKDSFDNNNIKSMRIIDGDKNRDLIDFYMKEFLWLKSIKHKKILNVEAFGIVETINLKPNNHPLYYVISDKQPSSTLDSVFESLSFSERIKIIQHLISIVDYLHFRGFVYKYLDPKKIFYSKEDGLRLLNITSVIDNEHIKSLDQVNENFVAPTVLIRKNKENISNDYYSIGMIMRYLLLENYSDEKSFVFFEHLDIEQEDRELLKNIITALINTYKNHVETSLINIIDELNKIINEKFIHKYKEDREHLYFKTKIIGREKELMYINEIDNRIENNKLDFNGLIIKGMSGVGKTRLINEISYRLKIKGRNVFKVNVDQTLSFDYDIISILINIITHNVDRSILDRYRSSFIKFIPEKYNYEDYYVNENSLQKIEIYKLYNSIYKYLKEISFKGPVYIIIDNIDKYNRIFVNLIDYLLQSLFNSKVFIIFTYDNFEEEIFLSYNIKKWLDKKFIEEITLENLTREDIAVLIQNILGMSFAPEKFGSVLYDASKGKPRFLDLIIKEIYNNKELYISKVGRWHSEKDSYTDLSLPTNFRNTILKQTKNITGDKLKVLKLISVSNESMSKFLIYNMLDFDIKYLNSIINSLLNEQILVENSYDNSFFYGFLSNELKATVYYDIDEEEKKALHKDLAELLMEYKPNILRDLVDEISYHLIRSQERRKAIELVVKEANKFENIYIDKAISLWEMAFSIVKDIDHERKLDILEILTKINLHKSNVEKLELYLKEFSKEADRSTDIEYIIKAKNYYAEIYLRNNDIDKLKEIIEEISRLSIESDYLEGIILSYIINISMLIKNSCADRAYIKNMLERALNLSERNNIKSYLGKIYFQYGLFTYIDGESFKSIEYYEKSINYLEENGDIYETIKAINNIGDVCLEQTGDKTKCFDYFHQGLELANKYGFTHLETIFLYNIGEGYLNMFEYKKAAEYTKKAISIANSNKDISLMIVSNCNMGRIHLLVNEYDKAYRIYNLLQEIYIEEEVTDTEIIIAYRNFLGEFYFKLGKYDLSIKNSTIAKKISRGFRENEYIKAIFRITHIEYIKGILNKDRLFKVLKDCGKENIREICSWNILILTVITLQKKDFGLANELMEYYNHKVQKSKEPELITDVRNVLDLYLSCEEENLINIEEKINEIENRNDYNIDLRFYILLANEFKNQKNYKKSMRYNIKTFDGIYNAINYIEDDDLKLSFIINLNAQGIKNNINEILHEYYGMKISSTEIDDIEKVGYHNYFDLAPVIDSLTNREINEIVAYHDDFHLASVDELIFNFDTNYLNNISLILKYLGKETLAQRGFVLTFSSDIINLEPLVSLIKGDNNLPNEMILLQSLRQENGFLFNFNSPGFSQSKYTSCLPQNARGVICIPITSDKNNASVITNHYNMNEDNLYGYIYLETNNALNRFDQERSKLAYSLSKLISLNLENQDLIINSITDKLTTAYTRKYFEFKFDTILETYRRKEGKLSLLMIDIDEFKGFNDKYGHLKGDEVLKLVGESIKSTVNSNGIVGRYGGEEFIVLLLDCELEKAINIGEQLRSNIEDIQLSEIEGNITVSIGLAQFPSHGSYKMELINNADQALYHAKDVLLRNKLAVWHRDMHNKNRSIDKTKGIISGNPVEINRNVLQLMDIAESIKDNKHIEDKIYHLLGSIIAVSNCEYATFIQYYEGKISKYYTRKREVIEWLEDSHIHLNLVDQVFEKKMGIFTIDWHDEFKNDFHIPDWDSVLIVPIIKNQVVKGILYITVPLKEREFNQEALNVINLFANIFSGNF